MAWSEKAIEAVLFEFDLDIEDEVNKANAQRALDAAAAVDGDAQWNAAIEAATQKAGAEFCGAFEGIGDDTASAIRSLKRLK